MMVIAIGNVKIKGGIIYNVMHVPLRKKYLLYVDALDIIVIKVVLSKGLCKLLKKYVLLFVTKKVHGLSRLDVKIRHH